MEGACRLSLLVCDAHFARRVRVNVRQCAQNLGPRWEIPRNVYISMLEVSLVDTTHCIQRCTRPCSRVTRLVSIIDDGRFGRGVGKTKHQGIIRELSTARPIRKLTLPLSWFY